MKENEIDEEKMIDLTDYYLYFSYYKGKIGDINNLNEIIKNPEFVR